MRSRPTTRSRIAAAAAAVTALATLGLAACSDSTVVNAGDGASPTSAATGDPAVGAGELLLRVDTGGGFVPIEVNLTHLPELSIYEDGLVLQPAPMIMIYPGPALPGLTAVQLSDAGLDQLREAIAASGLDGEAPDYGQPPIADAPSTTVTFTLDGTTYEHVAYALGFPDEGPLPGLTEEQQAARQRLSDFVAEVSDLRALVGEDEVSEPAPWVPDRYRLWAQPASDIPPGTPAMPAPEPPATTTTDGGATGGSASTEDPNAAVSSPVQPAPTDGEEPTSLEPQPTLWTWPIAAVDLAAVGHCLAVSGEDALAVGALFAQADQLTRFDQGGVAYAVVVRPMLPDEPDCPVGGGAWRPAEPARR